MAKVIMVQGTMSNAGKSLICAGLCRIFKQDGYKVAPFKSQNMALNSYITEDGMEMGRAQAMQAFAAGIKPHVDMNPILLKPVTHMGSQVIVGGKVIGNMKATEYYAMKSGLIPNIMEAYNRLASEYDIIVIEGAGSPAEINLKDGDFVNMGMAKLVDSPVILVGDIDRGGVFAQIYGTVKLLEPEEQNRIKATVINKFRGDVSLLEDGLKQLEKLTEIPVAGVVPMMKVDIDDEDSLSDRLNQTIVKGLLDIAVIRTDKISNFTDLAPLEAMSGVGIRYVSRMEELGNPDMIVIPGSKNTIEDLKILRSNGLEAGIKQAASKGIPVFGICGGYQMLGCKINDKSGVEGGGEVFGMGLLPIDTVFEDSKLTTQSRGELVMNVDGESKHIQVKGYEIHMGHSTLRPGGTGLIRLADGRMDGCVCGNVFGTYLHGIFDNDEFRNIVITMLAKKKGVDINDSIVSFESYRDEQYDILAKELRDSLDMNLIYKIVNKEL